MCHNFEYAAHGIARSQCSIDLGLHALLGLRVGTVQKDLVLCVKLAQLLPGNLRRCDRCFAYGNYVAQDLNPKLAQEQLGHCADSDARRRLARRGALQRITRLRKVVLERRRQISVSGTWRCYSLVLCRITLADGQGLLPVLPVAVLEQHGDRRANGLAVTHTGDNVRRIFLNLHPSAAPESLLSAPQFPVYKALIDGHSSRQPREKCNQHLSMRFSGSVVAKHALTRPCCCVTS